MTSASPCGPHNPMLERGAGGNVLSLWFRARGKRGSRRVRSNMQKLHTAQHNVGKAKDLSDEK